MKWPQIFQMVLPLQRQYLMVRSEDEIRSMLKLAYPDDIAKSKGLTATRTQAQLYDGRTGDAFDRTTTVGYMHFLKLHHLVMTRCMHVQRALQLGDTAAIGRQSTVRWTAFW